MNKTLELFAFVVLLVGTVGLLTNEFLFDWGTTATLVFAGANVIGLLAFAIAYWSGQSVA